jgi:hypothetical protein
MTLLLSLLLVGDLGVAQLVCPPFCVGDAGNVYRALSLPLVFRGRVVMQRASGASKRINGASGEVNHLVELLEVKLVCWCWSFAKR